MNPPEQNLRPTLPMVPASAMLVALGWGFLMRSLVIAVIVSVVIGVPTDVVANPWFTRMTPVMPLDYVFLVATSVLTGMIFASSSYGNWFGSRGSRPAATVGGILGWLAIGCPICNKLVVALLGISGALKFFGPVQPLIGAASVLLSVVALAIRFHTLRGQCVPIPGISQRCQIARVVAEQSA